MLGKQYFIEHNNNFHQYLIKVSTLIKQGLRVIGFTQSAIIIDGEGRLKVKCETDPSLLLLEGVCTAMHYTPQNREVIENTIKSILPNAEIIEWKVNEKGVIDEFTFVSESWSDLIYLFSQN